MVNEPTGGGGRPVDWWLLGLDRDPVPQDGGDLQTMADRYHSFADAIAESARGSRALVNDPAITSWVGKSGQAFKNASEPFPGMLDNAATAYRDVGDAFAVFARQVNGIQSQTDMLLLGAISDYESFEQDSGLPDDAVRAILTTSYGPQVENKLDDNASRSTLSLQAYKAAYPTLGQYWHAIVARRGTLETHQRDIANAKLTWMSAVEDAAGRAQQIVKQFGGAGPTSLNFGERFSAFGGDVMDLALSLTAGSVDLLGAEIPPEGTDPSTVLGWWKGLSPEMQSKLIADHGDLIGSLDGIPCDTRDKVNRALLDAEIARLQQDGTDPKQLAVLKHLRSSLNVSGQVWQTDNHQPYATGDSSHFRTSMPPLLLLHFDTDGNGHMIMAAGNPDTAANVVTYVPGLGTTLSDHMIDNDIPHTENLYLQAMDNHPGTTVSSVFWLGYNAPVLGGGENGLGHTLDVAGDANAKAAAPGLTNFLTGLHATSTTGSPVHYTALGHSYGSLVVGTAAAQPGGIPVDDIVLVGSPGVGSAHASDLHLAAGHVWAGSAANDPVPRLRDAVDAASNNFVFVDPGPGVDHFFSDLFGTDTHGGWFGQNPVSSDFGATVFKVAPGDTTGIPAGMNAHGEYFDPASRPPTRASSGDCLSNMANIIVGDYSKVTAG